MSQTPRREHGIIYRNTENLFAYNGWPSVAVLPDGTVLAVCSGHRLAHVCPFGKSLLFRSTNSGRTWSAPCIANDTLLDDRDTGLVHLGGENLLLTWFSHGAETFFNDESFYYAVRGRGVHAQTLAAAAIECWRDAPPQDVASGSFLRLSQNNGKSWGEKIRVPVTAPHGPALLSDGRLLYIGNIFPLADGSLGPVCAYESCDSGKTWQYLCELPRTAGYEGQLCEPHCLELPNGDILAALRYQGPGLGGSGSLFTIFLSRSTDGGKTFTEPQPTGIFGSPPHLMLTKSGHIVMSYGRRTAPYGERAVVSIDGGQTWSSEYELIAAPDSDLGYPATAELPDGSLLTVYYQKYADDPLTSLLYTIWNYRDND